MTPKSTAERMQKLRDGMRAAGFVLRQVWVHPADWPKIKAAIARAAVKRRKP